MDRQRLIGRGIRLKWPKRARGQNSLRRARLASSRMLFTCSVDDNNGKEASILILCVQSHRSFAGISVAIPLCWHKLHLE